MHYEQHQIEEEERVTWHKFFNLKTLRYLILLKLYMPKGLVEPNDFRNTLQYLYFWRGNVVKLSNETRLAAYKEKKENVLPRILALPSDYSLARLYHQSKGPYISFCTSNKIA